MIITDVEKLIKNIYNSKETIKPEDIDKFVLLFKEITFPDDIKLWFDVNRKSIEKDAYKQYDRGGSNLLQLSMILQDSEEVFENIKLILVNMIEGKLSETNAAIYITSHQKYIPGNKDEEECNNDIIKFMKSVDDSNIDEDKKQHLINSAHNLMMKNSNEKSVMEDLEYFCTAAQSMLNNSNSDKTLILNILRWLKSNYELNISYNNKDFEDFFENKIEVKNIEEKFTDVLKNGGISGFFQRSEKNGKEQQQ